MDQSFEKEVDRFQAVDDNGKKYTVIVMQEFVRSRHMLGESIIPCMKRLVTSTGLLSPLNVLSMKENIEANCFGFFCVVFITFLYFLPFS